MKLLYKPEERYKKCNLYIGSRLEEVKVILIEEESLWGSVPQSNNSRDEADRMKDGSPLHT